MPVPYTFADQSGAIPLAELDANFAAIPDYANAAGTVTENAQPLITSLGTLTRLSVAGNVTATGIATVGYLNAVGNIQGSYILGNGSQLTGLPATYSNAEVAAYLPTYTGNISAGNISVTGNVTANYFIGNGSQLTGLPASYGNANVAAYLPTYTGNISAGNILITGLMSTSGNVRGGNINTTGTVTATGNIHGNYFIGNGSQLTGVITGPQPNIANGTSNVSIDTSSSNVTVGVGGTANIVTISTTGQYINGIVSVTGNVVANNFVGGGVGTPTVTSATNLDLSAATAVRVTGGGTFRLPSLTTDDIANLIPVNGDLIYNSSLNKIQGYENGAWGNLI